MKPSTCPGLGRTCCDDSSLQCLKDPLPSYRHSITCQLSGAAVTVPFADRLQLSKAHEFFPGTNDRVLLISGSLKVVSDTIAWLELQDSTGCPAGHASDLRGGDLRR